MKRGKQHTVPLTKRAVAILEEVKLIRQTPEGSAFVFPGMKKSKPLSNVAFAQLIKRMDESGFVPHGFRSSFRDWCGDCTKYPREIAEAALAHAVGNAVEQAYRRRDAIEKRRKLMDDWTRFIEAKAVNVVRFKPAETRA